MSDVTRGEWEMLAGKVTDLARRIDVMDTSGTRGVLVLQVQVTELAKDVLSGFAGSRQWQEDHERQHEKDARQRTAARRWGWMFAVAALAAVETPLLVLLSHLH